MAGRDATSSRPVSKVGHNEDCDRESEGDTAEIRVPSPLPMTGQNVTPNRKKGSLKEGAQRGSGSSENQTTQRSA